MPISVLRLDMRAPSFSKASPSELYAAALEMAVWADQNAFTAISLPEHHAVEDGYLPSPVTLAAIIAGRTREVRIGIMALLLPLYDPIRLAEDLAVVDLASGGRVGVTAGIGYRVEEYDMMGADWNSRGRVMDEYLDVLLRAWKGERFEWRGRTVQVTPLPATKPHPFLSIGGTGRNAARRAVRFDLPFQPSVDSPEVFTFYHEECQRTGTTPVLLPPGSGESIWISEDPDRTWDQIGEHLLYHATTYAAWQNSGSAGGGVVNSNAGTVQALRAERKYLVLTPDECVARAEANPAAAIVHFPLCGGTPPELAWAGLELYSSKVLPRLESV